MRIRRTIITLVVLCSLLSGCGSMKSTSPSAPASDTPEPTPESPTDTATPENTATATLTPTETLTPTPADPFVTPDGKDISCYFGPGIEYSVDGGLLLGERVPVLGRDALTLWLQIENPRIPGKNRMCWVPIEKVITEGDIQSAPIVEAPVSIVTAVTVSVKPSRKELNPCSLPYSFKVEYTIQVTGPVTVTYTNSTSTGVSSSGSLKFSKAGSKTLTASLKVNNTGDHWYMVSITSPNVTSGTGYAELVCP